MTSSLSFKRSITTTTPTTPNNPPKLITPQALSSAIKADHQTQKIKIIDASWHMPNSNRSALTEFQNGPRLPQSRFFDHELIASSSNDNNNNNDHLHPHQALQLAHMRPNSKKFEIEMSSLGISFHDDVVIYDSLGIFSAPRAAWLLHSFGHPSITILDGGLPRWIAEGFETEQGPPVEIKKEDYQLDPSLEKDEGTDAVASYADIIANISQPSFEILDARPRPRFEGTAPEPRPGLSSGHIPGSLSLPFNELLTDGKTEGYRTFLKPDQLESIFISTFGGSIQRWESIKTGQKKLVASCGSGMTACIIWMAIQICATHHQLSQKVINTTATTTTQEIVQPQVKIYDESWTGYAGRKESPIIKTRVEE